jgi:homoserine kinase
VIIRVPASSANLGPGFDTLGMALSLHAEAGVVDGDIPAGAQLADQYHPASVAFRRAGGEGELWVASPIPVGRGLGFSGAVRIAGIVAAHAQQHGSDPDELSARAHTMLALATELEGHADNVAASLFGGIVATADGRAVRIPLAFDPAVVVWIPSFTTSTDESRTKMGANVPLDDAVFNIGRVALLVAALASGDTDALRSATQDRLHQDRRLESVEPSKVALAAALDAGAWCSWLSGSGPTVAAMCPFDEADDLAAKMPEDGHTKVLRIDHGGAVIESHS